MVEKFKVVTLEQFSVRIGEQIADGPLPQVDVAQILKERVEVVNLFPQERVQRQTNEHTVDMTALHILKEIVEARGWSRKNACNNDLRNILWLCLCS